MDVRTLLALLTTVFFWSSAFVAIRISLHDFLPGALALLRYLTASLAILPIYFSLKNKVKIQKGDWPLFFFTGLSGFTIYNIALNKGEVSVSAGIASFIVGLFTILLAIVFLKEKLKPKSLLGIALSFVGIFLIAASDIRHVEVNKGVLYTLMAALCASVYAVLQKNLFKRYPPLQVAAVSIWLGTAFLLIYTPSLFAEITRASFQSTFSAVYMGVFPGVIGYLAWSYALSRVPASQAATALYTMPVVTTIIGYFYLSETPSSYSLLGGLVTLMGAIQVNHCYFKRQNKLINPAEAA